MDLAEIINIHKHIVFLGGAGVSTESGIPDFRSEGTTRSTIKRFGTTPEIILSKTFFWEHTDIFYDYYKQSLINSEAEPNDAHIALAKLETLGKLDGIITQNIDGLHQKAGNKKVIELHGSVYSNHCTSCGKAYSLEQVMRQKGVPKCNHCGHVIKPDVVLYEEALDDNKIRESCRMISEAEVLIVGGTSLNVYPAAGLLEYFQGAYLILINIGNTPYDRYADLVIRERIGTCLKAVIDKME